MPRPEATDRFLKSVLSEVRWKQAHAGIKRELSDHVEDQARAFRAEGMDEASAEKAAIREMGDPLTLGTAFDAAYRPRPTWQVLLPIGLTLLCGLLLHLMLYAPMEHFESYANETIYKELMALLIGGALFTAAYLMNFNTLAKLCLPLAAAILLVLYYCDYDRYYYPYSLSVYSLLLLPVAAAGVLYTLRKLGVGAVLICDALVILAVWLYGEYYRGALHLCVLTSFAVLLAGILLGVCRGKKWLLLLALILPFAAGFAYMHPLMPQALYGFFKAPSEDWLRYMEETRALLRGTRWFGRGSTVYLPADALKWYGLDPTDDWFRSSQWALAGGRLPLYICYHYGRAAALAIAALPLSVVVTGAVRVKRLSGKLGRLFGLAALGTLLVQWIYSMLAASGITLHSAFPLPFLSVGYYALIADMALLGVVCAVLRSDGLR